MSDPACFEIDTRSRHVDGPAMASGRQPKLELGLYDSSGSSTFRSHPSFQRSNNTLVEHDLCRTPLAGQMIAACHSTRHCKSVELWSPQTLVVIDKGSGGKVSSGNIHSSVPGIMYMYTLCSCCCATAVTVRPFRDSCNTSEDESRHQRRVSLLRALAPISLTK